MSDDRPVPVTAFFEGRSTGWSNPERVAFGLLVLVLAGSLFVLVHPWYDLTNDGSIYIITARAIAGGEGYSFLGNLFSMRPPGFSAMLAFFIGGHEATDFAAVNWVISFFGAFGVVLLYVYQRAHVGWLLAMLTSLAIWLNPGYQRLCNQVMSDVPGVTLLLVCLLLERWSSREPGEPSWGRQIALGLVIGVSAYVRSIIILLVPAVAVARLLGRFATGRARGRDDRGTMMFVLERLLVPAVVAWCVLVPWNLARQRHAPPPPADQTLNYSISTAMWHEDPGDPTSRRYTLGEIAGRIPQRVHDLALVVGSRMQYRIPGSPVPQSGAALGHGVLALLSGVCLLIVLFRRRAPAEWFAAGVIVVVATYFIFTDRLALPVFVFALAATVEVFRDLVRHLAGAVAGTAVPAAALLVLIAVDVAPRQDWERIRARHQSFVEMADAIDGELQPDARLAAAQGFHYQVYLRRPVYGMMHAVRRAGQPEAAEQIIDKYEVNTVVLSPLVPPDMKLIPYFRQRYGTPTQAGPAVIWRVRP